MSEGPHPELLHNSDLSLRERLRAPTPLPEGEVSRSAGEGLALLTRPRIVASARAWLGTPYVHQASAKGQGTDCLGLLRGLYAELHGAEPEAPPPYTPDWNETRSAEEPLLSAARRHLVERSQPSPALGGRGSREARGEGGSRQAFALVDAPSPLPPLPLKRERGEGILPGQILIFRIMTTGPAKHCGVAVSEDHFIHAYAGRAVIESWLTRWWMERLAGVFDFPGVEK